MNLNQREEKGKKNRAASATGSLSIVNSRSASSGKIRVTLTQIVVAFASSLALTVFLAYTQFVVQQIHPVSVGCFRFNEPNWTDTSGFCSALKQPINDGRCLSGPTDVA
jgi:hypothetical protein